MKAVVLGATFAGVSAACALAEMGYDVSVVTADISITDAALTATGSEALCLEGKNSVTLTNCTLTGSVLVSGESDLTITVSEYIAE